MNSSLSSIPSRATAWRRIIGPLLIAATIVAAVALLSRPHSAASGVTIAGHLELTTNASQTGYNVVLLSLDTLRADRLGCYGYHRPTSPNIDRLAQNSAVFWNAFTAAPATAESHMSIFTALYPSVHKVSTTYRDDEPIHRLDRAIVTLPQVLQQHGYRTVAFHGGGHVSEDYGFGRGFDLYNNAFADLSTAVRWIRRKAKDGKFFLFGHTYRVHAPYLPDPPYDSLFLSDDYRGRIIHDREALRAEAGRNVTRAFWNRVNKDDPDDIQRLSDLYDGLVAQLDAEMGILFDAIDEHAPNTIIVVLSDHGEEFGEHGRFQHGRLFEEILRVPLIIRHPGLKRGKKITAPVSLLNLAPAILEMLSIPVPEQFQAGFVPGIDPGGPIYPIFAEFPVGHGSTVVLGQEQYIVGHGEQTFYRLAGLGGKGKTVTSDGGGHGITAARQAQLKRLLRDFERRNEILAAVYNTSTREQTLDPKTLERLKSLGYIK